MILKKRILTALVFAVLAAMLAGCGVIIVEDAEPVRIGMEGIDRRLT